MSEMQPKMKELQKLYANDKQLQNQKMMEMYKKEKFNPASGCLPALLQLPIIFGLFALLRDPMRYIEGIEMLIATHESFLWVMDLSQPDPWFLPVGAGITTFISFAQTQAQNKGMSDANPAMTSMMKMMKYFFPVMIMWMGHTFPAGLTFYWFIGNLFTIVQYQVLRKWRKRLERMMDEGKGSI